MNRQEEIKKIFVENWESVFSMLLGKEPQIVCDGIVPADGGAAAAALTDFTAGVRLSFAGGAADRMCLAGGRRLVSIVSNLMMGLSSFRDEISNDDRDAFVEAVNQMFSSCQVPLKENLDMDVKFSDISFSDSGIDALPDGDAFTLWKFHLVLPDLPEEKFLLVTPTHFEAEAVPEIHLEAERPAPPPMGGVQEAPMQYGGRNIDFLLDVELPITVRIGSTEWKLIDIMKIGIGSIIELEKMVDDPVEVLVNDKLVARGEVVVYDSNFAIRITEVESKENRIRSLV